MENVKLNPDADFSSSRALSSSDTRAETAPRLNQGFGTEGRTTRILKNIEEVVIAKTQNVTTLKKLDVAEVQNSRMASSSAAP